jgi:hypothetical protein
MRVVPCRKATAVSGKASPDEGLQPSGSGVLQDRLQRLDQAFDRLAKFGNLLTVQADDVVAHASSTSLSTRQFILWIAR